MKEDIKSAVLRVVEENHEAMEPSDVFQRVQAHDFEQFTNSVKQLQEDGMLIITRKGKLISPKTSGLVPARIVSHSPKFSFARPLDGGEDIYISEGDRKKALPGDLVMLHKLRTSYKGLDGAVERVVVKGSRLITGTLSRARMHCEVIPDANFRSPIPVEKGATLGARNGDKVQVLLSFRPRTTRLSARVIKIYGKASSARICADAIIDAYGIPTQFPAEATMEAKHLAHRGISQKEKENRLDLRDECIFTIDGADAKDLDDAVSVKKTEDGWDLGVHIADVSHYVQQGTPLDQEALKRGTSVYFADRVIPMLPKELSNGICSLNAGEEKLTFSALIHLDTKGKITSYEFQKSMICSKVRGVYSEVNQIFDGTADEEIEKKYQPVMKSLTEAKELAALLEQRGIQRGVMDLESGECRFTLDEKGICVDISARVQGEAEKMIEQFMLTANQAAAMYARSVDIPFVYRVHESPDLERVRTLSELAGALGLKNRRLREGVRSSDFAALLREAAPTPAAKVISSQVLRTMAKARYDFRPLGHFGLALEDYCHFTSPIRRYPDTAIHRILSDLVKGVPVSKIQKKYTEFAADAASESSQCEVRAMRAERDAEKCYMAEYMTQHIGEEYDGIISGTTARGIFVELANGVEGFVSLEYFPECRFHFDGLTTHTDEISGRQLTIGGALRIQVAAADVATGMIDFVPAEKG